MKKLLTLLILCLSAIVTMAQSAATNTAFKDGETVSYVLKFSLGPVNMTVGTATWSVQSSTYKNQKVHKVSLRTMTNKRADKYFVLRDTMTTYVTDKLVPMLFQKRGREGKRYKQDNVTYSYSGGKCNASTYHRVDTATPKTSKYSNTTCCYDMISMMLRARSFNPEGWTTGKKISFLMVDGKGTSQQSIVYRGKKNIKLEDGSKYRTLVFSFMEKEKGKSKESEIVRFYVTDDDNHLPVRLDMNLTFGSAKAYMSSCSGVRNALTSKL